MMKMKGRKGNIWRKQNKIKQKENNTKQKSKEESKRENNKNKTKQGKSRQKKRKKKVSKIIKRVKWQRDKKENNQTKKITQRKNENEKKTNSGKDKAAHTGATASRATARPSKYSQAVVFSCLLPWDAITVHQTSRSNVTLTKAGAELRVISLATREIRGMALCKSLCGGLTFGCQFCFNFQVHVFRV